jgi:hypothetical protein
MSADYNPRGHRLDDGKIPTLVRDIGDGLLATRRVQ